MYQSAKLTHFVIQCPADFRMITMFNNVKGKHTMNACETRDVQERLLFSRFRKGNKVSMKGV
jgi:hypothetical protein